MENIVEPRIDLCTAYENILTEKNDKVGIITLNRPKALNALCDALVGLWWQLNSMNSDKSADSGCECCVGRIRQ